MWWLGVWQPADRVALAQIWRSLVRDDPAFRVLFVGVRPYTWRLTRSRPHAHVVTVDRDPSMRFFGSSRHRVTALEELPKPDVPFDLAVVNGVFGYGIDTIDAADRAAVSLHEALREGGLLVLGLNESRPSTPTLDRVTALARFRPAAPPPIGEHRHVVASPFEGTHTLLFYEKRTPDP